jgi:hypothetical protein
MAEFIKIRGLARRGFRVANQQVTSGKNVVVDLDVGQARRDLAHHMSIGQVVVVGETDVAVERNTGKVTPGTTTTVSVSAGTLYNDSVTGQYPASVTVPGVANTAVTAADPTNPRIDLVTLNRSTGAAVVTAGTAAATPVPPAQPANTVVVATVRVPAAAASSAAYTITDVAPRL